MLAYYMHKRLENNQQDRNFMSTKEIIDKILQTAADSIPENSSNASKNYSEILRLQEIYYNLGRIFQSVQINYIAVHMYKKALQLSDDYIFIKNSPISLTGEAAYNLLQIYRESESDGLAMELIHNYLSYE